MLNGVKHLDERRRYSSRFFPSVRMTALFAGERCHVEQSETSHRVFVEYAEILPFGQNDSAFQCLYKEMLCTLSPRGCAPRIASSPGSRSTRWRFPASWHALFWPRVCV